MKVVESDLGYQLKEACDRGDLEQVKELIKLGADKEYYRGWPLQKAARFSRKNVVDYLLNLGVDINSDKSRALRICLVDRNFEMALYLLQKGAAWPPAEEIPESEKSEIPKEISFKDEKEIT